MLIVATLLLISTVESKKRNNFHKHIEIYKPKGLTVWYPKSPGLVEVGVEVFLNRGHKYSNHCDICLNTTASAYGKFVMQDDDAVIRAGDNLQYRFSFRYSDGRTPKRNDFFYVAESKIFHKHLQCPSTTSTSTTGVQLPRAAVLQEDIDLLEEIAKDVFEHCNNVTEISKNLYLDSRPAPNLDPKKLYEFTLNELQTMLPKINWNKVLVHTFYYNDGVGFEVMTHIDKQKVLKLSRNFNRTAISDFDDLEESTSTSNYNEDYNDVLPSSG